MAYLYNVTNHLETNQSLAGAWHRIPNPADFKVELANLPNEKLKYILYDLNTKSAHTQGIVEAGLALEAGETDHDFFLLVIPEGA